MFFLLLSLYMCLMNLQLKSTNLTTTNDLIPQSESSFFEQDQRCFILLDVLL